VHVIFDFVVFDLRAFVSQPGDFWEELELANIRHFLACEKNGVLPPPVDWPQKSTKGAKEKTPLLFCAFCAFSRQ
jgi:hypothetical protein